MTSSTWDNDTTATRSAAYFEAWLNTGCIRAENYASGDGSDESEKLQRAISDAGSANRLVLQRGKTYTIGSTLTITGSLRLEGNGATIKRSATLNGRALSISGANVELIDLNVDGNRSGGNANLFGCIFWTGAGGVARRVKATNSVRQGFLVQGAGASLDAYECEASNHVSGANAGDGFFVQSGGLLRTWNCRGDNNDRSGFLFGANSAYGCHLDGTANNNSKAGTEIFCSNGTCGTFYSRNNAQQGVYLFGSATTNHWTFDHVEDCDAGKALNGEYTPNPSATGVELFGASHCHFATVVVRRSFGYGVAVTRDTGTLVGAVSNTFGDVYVEDAGDPAFHISGGTQFTSVGTLTTNTGTSVAVSFGEGVPNDANDYNTFQQIRAYGCSFGVINLEAGSFNTFGSIIATDCVNNSPYTSLIRCLGAGTTVAHNTVHYWESSNANSTPPTFIMLCDSNAFHNWIAAGFMRDSGGTTALSDAGGSSRVDFATAP